MSRPEVYFSIDSEDIKDELKAQDIDASAENIQTVGSYIAHKMNEGEMIQQAIAGAGFSR